MSRRAVLQPRAAPGPSRPDSSGGHSRLRILAGAATATTFVLIAVGGLVRATGSGLGCTGWPKCTADRWLPPLEYHAVIEYSHRFTAVLDIVLVALLALVAWRRYRGVPRVLRPALAAVVLVVFQAVLGGIVVHGDLEALLVTAHLGTAMLFAGVLVVATVGAFSLDAGRRLPLDAVSISGWAAAVGTFALIAVGAYVRGQGAGLAFTDWPLMDGRLIPHLSRTVEALQFAHRALAVVVAGLVALLVVRSVRGRPGRDPATALAMAAAGLLVAQVVIGAANVWSRLAAGAVVAHVAVAGLTWGAVVASASAAAFDWGGRAHGGGVP